MRGFRIRAGMGQALVVASALVASSCVADSDEVRDVTTTSAPSTTTTAVPSTTTILSTTTTAVPTTAVRESLERLHDAVALSLEGSNRGVRRLPVFDLSGRELTIRFAVNYNFFPDALLHSARMDVHGMLKAIQESEVDYDTVSFEATYDMGTDEQPSEEVVLQVWYKRAVVDGLNFTDDIVDGTYTFITTEVFDSQFTGETPWVNHEFLEVGAE